MALISLGSVSFSQQIIVLDKDEICYADAKNTPCLPSEIDKQDFVNIFKNINFRDSAQVSSIPLTTPPLEWGKKVSDATTGEIVFYNEMIKGFIMNLSLNKLLPNHRYLLTLNGKPELDGNNLLPDTVPNLSAEKYYDFLSIQTDSHGEYRAKIGIYLKKGDYHVRFYVKDTDDFKIVLYHDYFRFTIK